MRKSKNIIISIILILSFCLSSLFTGCNSSTTPTGGEDVEYTVWSAPSTIKILQDDINYADKGDAKVKIQMAKNEYESTQLMITVTDGKGTYSLTTSDLYNANRDKISKSAISVFNEKYMETTTKSNSTFQPGLYPDALLPLDVAIEYGENVVEAGYNQGLWIKVKTETETPAGVYTGTFVLDVNGNKTNIPVEVTVWDFAISTESHARTAFNYYIDDMAVYEGDTSDEMLEKYYEFFLDYRVNLMKLPCKNSDLDAFVELVKEYQDDERVNTWCLPGLYHQESTEDKGVVMEGDDIPSFRRIMELVSMLIAESVKDNVNYLSKATWYDITTDEYSMHGNAVAEYAANRYKVFRQYLKELVDRYDTAFGTSYIDSIDELRDDILYLPIISVSSYVYGVTDEANIWCPLFNEYALNQESYQEKMEELDTPNKEMWWYGCVGPVYPYPTYHIDDVLCSSRLVSWMQYDLGITGNLYYQVILSTRSSSSVEVEVINPYESPNRYGSNNGDGYLVYPGVYYGIDGPVASMRLESIRDGMEEYEYLYELDRLYQEQGSFYNVLELSYKGIYDELANKMYTYGAVKRDLDVDVIEEAREKIASAILGLKQKEKFIVESEVQEGAKKTISVLFNSSVEVQENENFVRKEQAGQGMRYVYEYDISGINEVKFIVNYVVDGVAKTYSKVIQTAKQILSSMTTSEDLALVNVTSGSSKTLEADGVKVNLATDKSLSDFMPYFGIGMSNYKHLNVDSLSIVLYSNKEVDCELVYRTSILQSAPTKVHLDAGVNYVTVLLTDYSLKDLTRIIFRFPNEGDDYEIKIGDVGYYE